MGWYHNLATVNKMHFFLLPTMATMVAFAYLYASALNAQQLDYQWVVVLTLLVLVNAFFFGASFFRGQIAFSANAVKQLDNGAKNSDISHRLPEQGDEVGQICHAVNELLEAFADNIKTINSLSERLDKDAGLSLQEIQASQAMMAQQLVETGQLATAIEQMSATAQEIAQNTVQALEATNNSRQAAEAGSRLVASSITAVTDLSGNITEVGEQVENLASRSEDVSKVLEVIKSVAEQTNLLALNAAIEAARAGEQGRGFAVVADEVRTLASRTQDSAEEITQIVATLQAQSETANSVVKSCLDSAAETVSQVSGLTDVLTEVEHSASLINEMSAQIAAASEEQVATSVHIAENVMQVDNMTKGNSEKFNHLTQLAEDNLQLSKEMQVMVGRYTV